MDHYEIANLKDRLSRIEEGREIAITFYAELTKDEKNRINTIMALHDMTFSFTLNRQTADGFEYDVKRIS